MQKLLYILLGTLLFACNKAKVDYVFDKLPEQRMKERNAELQNLLTGSANGWKAFLRTSLNGGGYGFYMKFDAQDYVTMLSDWNTANATTQKQSTYRVQYISNSTLIFDSYTYISILQDPNSANNGGSAREGLQSDVEFEYLRNSGDTIILKGRKYKNTLFLLKASTSDAAAYTGGGYATAIDAFKTYFSTKRNNYFSVDSAGKSNAIIISFNNTTKLFNTIRLGANGAGVPAATGFGFSNDGVFLTDPIKLLGTTFTALKQKDANTIVVIDAQGKEYAVQQSTTPILPLKAIIGTGVTAFTIPNATAYAGWSADFTARRAQVRQSLLTGGYNLTLGKIVLTFGKAAQRMSFVADIPQGATQFTATFNLYYNQADDGTITFTKASDYLGTNAAITEAGFGPILGQRLLTDSFAVDYYDSGATGVLAVFTSVQHPEFSFTTVF
ncbi:DUF4302 domain-containing protein [Niabella sp.]|uniref:DUF4302 domain-containing protein n=1 Tax=Niabella sp. TaxID=1962976 RepID=UPI0026298E75|nr:DUF4302 domain-containing protein [Niabella sp.]